MANKSRPKRMRENESESSTERNQSNDSSNYYRTNNKRQNAEHRQPLRKVYHYPSTLPFPVLLTDTFPEEPYRSRNKDVKSAVHWGQRKLLLSEIQLLSQYCIPQTSYHIVYAGSAPGTHLGFLDDMFNSRHTWELIDPGQFNRAVLESRPNFKLRNEFFTNATAYDIVARCLHNVASALGCIYAHLTIDELIKQETHKYTTRTTTKATTKATTTTTTTDETHANSLSSDQNAKSDSNNINIVNRSSNDRSENSHDVCRQDYTVSSRERMSEVHAQLQHKMGTLDVARGTVDIPSMYEEPLYLPIGIELLCRVTLEQRHKPLLFISDIRSGSVELSNFEEHVIENMRAQECWTNILHASYSMLKFRLPYTTKATEFNGQGELIPSSLINSNGTVRYLRGDILLPIWTRPTSTEGRLVVPQGAMQKEYDVAHVENQFFFFNARVREQIHFNHILDTDAQLDHHFDGAAEVECLKTYLLAEFPELQNDNLNNSDELATRIRSLSERITDHLKVSFADVIRRRESILLKYARQPIKTNKNNNNDNDNDNDNKVDNRNNEKEHEEGIDHAVNGAVNNNNSTSQNLQKERYGVRQSKNNEWESFTRKMIRAAANERERGIWKSNIDEQEHLSSSGL